MTAHKTMFVPVDAIQMGTTFVTDAGGWPSNTINPIEPGQRTSMPRKYPETAQTMRNTSGGTKLAMIHPLSHLFNFTNVPNVTNPAARLGFNE
jgi:hypothetical protein